MVRLYINNVEVELDKTVQFAITKQFEHISNPTDIINDWSKTVSIPFTQKNNALFGHIYNADKITAYGGGLTGIYFNPLLKMDFRLEWNNAILMTGYAKMNEVKQTKGSGTYEITLFGTLGKVFQDLHKITFDESTEDTDYLIDGSQYVDEYISRNIVYSSWTASAQTYSQLFPKYIYPSGGSPVPHPAYKLTDIIGFAPNNAYGEEFDYTIYQPTTQTTKSFADTLGTGFTKDTGVEGSVAIGDGMLPREIGEYRSYYQLPYIYWNKLFQAFQYKAEEVTGYQFELHPSWFNTGNTYWNNLVYMLKPFNVKDGSFTDDANYYKVKPYTDMRWLAIDYYSTALQEHITRNLTMPLTGSTDYHETIPLWNSGFTPSAGNDSEWFTMSGSSNSTAFKILSRWKLSDFFYNDGYMNGSNALVVNVHAVGGNGYTETVKYIIKNSTSTITEPNANVIIHDSGTGRDNTNYIDIDADFIISRGKFGDTVRFRYEAYWKTTTWPLTSTHGSVQFQPIIDYVTTDRLSVSIYDSIIRSYFRFTLNTLWNNDYNLFEEIIRYCKMFRIGIRVDEIRKKIIFEPLCKYFSGYTVTDWTNKVDKNKDYKIVPVAFDTKYVLFNYEDSETKLGTEYKEKYGVNYGDYRLITEYNFNDDTKNLFEGVAPSIMNTDNVLSWNTLYTYHKIVYSFPAEIFVYNKDKDKNQVDLFGSFFYHKGLATFSTEEGLHMRSVNISDDTAFQQARNTYCYNQTGLDSTGVTTYPFLDIIKGTNMCLFNKPKENYTYLRNYNIKNPIYYNLWEDYINERYSPNNKIITCYVNLSPIDYINFEFKNFVKIGNQLCMVNKIYDYDVTANQSTKVDLITIQDTRGYTHTNYLS